jgi:hypothetical protein
MKDKCEEYGYILWQVVAVSWVSSLATSSTFSSEPSSMEPTEEHLHTVVNIWTTLGCVRGVVGKAEG